MHRLTQSASVQICSATPNSGSQRQLFPSERLARTPLTVHGGHGFKGLLSRNYPDFVTPQHFLAITSRTAWKGALSHSNHGLGVRGFSSRLSSACAATTSILIADQTASLRLHAPVRQTGGIPSRSAARVCEPLPVARGPSRPTIRIQIRWPGQVAGILLAGGIR